MDNPLVSVIIPTYNRGDLIEYTINSVLNQSYQNFEIIIMDDGSTDNTKSVVKRIKDERLIYKWQKNSGKPASARNSGLKLAKGEFIAFLDSDDIWFNKKLEIQIKEFKKNPDIHMLSTNVVLFRKNYYEIFLNIKRNKKIPFKELIKKNIIATSSVMLRRVVIEKVGYFDEDVKLKAVEDYEYWLRILKWKDLSILLLKSVLMMYRLHSNNISGNTSLAGTYLNKYRKISQVYSKINYKEGDKDTILLNIFYEYMRKKTNALISEGKINSLVIVKQKYLKPIDKFLLIIQNLINNNLKTNLPILKNLSDDFSYLIRILRK